MDSAQTTEPTSEQISENSAKNTPEREYSVERIQAMVTAEQEFSASVAKKRRNFTKRRSSNSHKVREQTPVRYLSDDRTTSEEDVPLIKPKTPERKRRRFRKSLNKADATNDTKSEPEFNTGFDDDAIRRDFKKSSSIPRELYTTNHEPSGKTIKKSSSIPKELLGTTNMSVSNSRETNSIPKDLLSTYIHASLQNSKKSDGSATPSEGQPEESKSRRDSLIDMAQVAQAEVKAFFSKTKKQITDAASRGRNRFRKEKERIKRSKSAPHEFTEEQLIESFKKAQLINGIYSDMPKGSSVIEYSESSLDEFSPLVAGDKIVKRSQQKSFRPEANEFLRQRKKERLYSTKVIEILDPKTSRVLAKTTIITKKSDYSIRQLFGIFKMYSLREIIKLYRIYKKEMYREYDKIRSLRKKCFTELFLLMIYCGVGGVMFKFIEGHFESYYKCGVKRVKRDFIDQLWVRSHNLREEDWKSMARNKLRIFEEELHEAHEAGVKTYSGQTAWNFLNGVVYCITVVTTIGYGHIYPTTFTGKVLTIVYSIIGIPLFLIVLTDFGKLFTRCIKFLWSFVRRVYYTGSCRKARKTAHVEEIFKGAQMMYEIATFRRPSMFVDPENPETIENPPQTDDTPTTPAISNFEIDDEFNLPISLAIFILVLYIFLGALVYCTVTSWNFFNAFYFVFISMSTIGFGDIVPNNPLIMIISIVYLVFGLALMSMCINVVQDKLSDTFKQASAKIGATMGIRTEEDGSICTVPPDPVELPPVHNLHEKNEEKTKNDGNLLTVEYADKKEKDS